MTPELWQKITKVADDLLLLEPRILCLETAERLRLRAEARSHAGRRRLRQPVDGETNLRQRIQALRDPIVQQLELANVDACCFHLGTPFLNSSWSRSADDGPHPRWIRTPST